MPEFVRYQRFTKTVVTILEHDCTATIRDWLARWTATRNSPVSRSMTSSAPATCLACSGIVVRLRQPQNLDGKRLVSQAAAEHGKTRHKQGYTADLMIEESRMLQQRYLAAA